MLVKKWTMADEDNSNEPCSKQGLRDAVQGILNGKYTTKEASKKFHMHQSGHFSTNVK